MNLRILRDEEPEPESSKICEACGGKVVDYPHNLNKGLASALRRLAQAGPGPHHLDDLDLTYSQRCNFQKLQYWGFVTRAHKGHWLMCDRGYRFLAGEPAPKKVWSFRGKYRRSGAEQVTVIQLLPGYDQREDYARDARPHTD